MCSFNYVNRTVYNYNFKFESENTSILSLEKE